MFNPCSAEQTRQIACVSVGGVVAGVLYVLSVLWLLYGVDRSDTVPIVVAVVLCVPGYLVLSQGYGLRSTFFIGTGLRVAALFAFPLLSDDIHRFLWDGAMWWTGAHPFSVTPEAYAVTSEGVAFAKTHSSLLTHMNSAGYFTVYPPLSQLVFAVASGVTREPYWGSVVLKSVLLLGELGVWWLLTQLTAELSVRYRPASFYWLNPLVIVETVGNAHFEGLALLGVLLALYALRRAGLGWARQGWVTLGDARTEAFGPRRPTLTHVSVGPGLPPRAVAKTPPTGTRTYWRWISLSAAALAAGFLVKLVPLILAPAFALACLWQWTRRPAFDEVYYASLPEGLQPHIRSMAGVSIERPALSGDAERLSGGRHSPPPATSRSPVGQHVLAGEWPGAQASDVIPPSASEVPRLRKGIPAGTHANPISREEAHALSLTHGGGPVVFPLLRGARVWDWATVICFGASLLVVCAGGMAGLLFASEVSGFGESLNMYFQKFEFNGSLYVLVRWLGTVYKGYNWIATVGPGLSALGGLSILVISAWRGYRGLDLAQTLLWCGAVYLACTTTVHPWYFVYLLGLGALTGYRWPMLLGFTAFLSYAAYATTQVEVPVWALLLEYGPVVWLAATEVSRKSLLWRERG